MSLWCDMLVWILNAYTFTQSFNIKSAFRNTHCRMQIRPFKNLLPNKPWYWLAGFVYLKFGTRFLQYTCLKALLVSCSLPLPDQSIKRSDYTFLNTRSIPEYLINRPFAINDTLLSAHCSIAFLNIYSNHMHYKCVIYCLFNSLPKQLTGHLFVIRSLWLSKI